MAAAAYAVGLLEVNAYLARYGVSDFDLLRPRYIAIGGLGLVILAVSAGLPAISVPRWVSGGLGLIVFLMTFAIFIAVTAQDVLPIVPGKIGGLRPTVVSIVVQPGDVAALRTAGLVLDSNGVSVRPVEFYKSSDFLLIEISPKRVVRLGANEVIGWTSAVSPAGRLYQSGRGLP